jgi:hypothetical protein
MTGRFYSSDTQIKWACNELLKGRSISHQSEIVEVRGWRLSAIIHNLRHKYGWPIFTVFDEHRIAWYHLDKQNQEQWPKLKKPPSFFRSKAAYQEHLQNLDTPPTQQG